MSTVCLSNKRRNSIDGNYSGVSSRATLKMKNTCSKQFTSTSEKSDDDADSVSGIPCKKIKHKSRKIKKAKKKHRHSSPSELCANILETEKHRRRSKLKYEDRDKKLTNGYAENGDIDKEIIRVHTKNVEVGHHTHQKSRYKDEPKSKWDSPCERSMEYRSSNDYWKNANNHTHTNNADHIMIKHSKRSNFSERRDRQHTEEDRRTNNKEYRSHRQPYEEQDNNWNNSNKEDFNRHHDSGRRHNEHQENRTRNRRYDHETQDNNKLDYDISNKKVCNSSIKDHRNGGMETHGFHDKSRVHIDKSRHDRSRDNVRTHGRDKWQNNSPDRKNLRHSERRRARSHSRNRSPSRPNKTFHKDYTWGKKDQQEDKNKPPIEKDKPNFGLSGKLTEDVNTFNGVVIKYSEPPEARKPKRRWRFYPFKGENVMPTLYIHRQSCYLIGRDRKVVDLPVDHPSCSKQHAALQYRLVTFQRDNGTVGKRIRPYLIDLESSNGTYVNNNKIESKKYVELLEKDVIKFGFSSREYVLLHENSKEENQDDDVGTGDEDVKKTIKQETR